QKPPLHRRRHRRHPVRQSPQAHACQQRTNPLQLPPRPRHVGLHPHRPVRRRHLPLPRQPVLQKRSRKDRRPSRPSPHPHSGSEPPCSPPLRRKPPSARRLHPHPLRRIRRRPRQAVARQSPQLHQHPRRRRRHRTRPRVLPPRRRCHQAHQPLRLRP